MIDVAGYWETRYAGGRGSGLGSIGHVARVKAKVVDRACERARSVLDIGCGDGQVASRIHCPLYLGVDVSPEAIRLARERCPTRRFAVLDPADPPEPRDLHLSLDVIYHLVVDDDYRAHLDLLFSARRLVVVCSTNYDKPGAPHVRHRQWRADQPRGWRVVARNGARGTKAALWTLRRV